MNIAVYLGANMGNLPVYEEKIRELGAWIGRNGHHLVYGGSKTGLMGILAMSVLENGGTVTGVEPRFFVDRQLQLDTLTELIVTETMLERKQLMMERAEFFIAFPGGTGTAEEIAEVISAGCLGHLQGTYGYYNINGFYDFAKAGYEKMVAEGFMSRENCDKIRFWSSLDEIAADVADKNKEE